MATSQIACFWCKTIFEKENKEVNRAEQLGRKHFCSLAHAAAYKNTLDESREVVASRNTSACGDKNPNWKGGLMQLAYADSLAVLRSRIKRPERYAARQCVKRALREGSLTRPKRCSSCKHKRFCEAHHADYSKPLEVKWLCFACHDIADAVLRSLGLL
jgi:hypothetical protein